MPFRTAKVTYRGERDHQGVMVIEPEVVP